MGALPIPKLSVEEYLVLDRMAEVPSEFHDGEMFPIEAVTYEHSIISVKVGASLDKRLKGSACAVAASLRVRVSPSKYLIPDQSVICGGPEFADKQRDTITNPKVILEILSPSTADYDYGHKFKLYRRLATFEEYLLISQDEALVERYRKSAEDRWILSIHMGLDAVVPIESLSISLPLVEIYEDVTFPPVVD